FVYFFPATLRQAMFSFGDILLFFFPTHLAYANALREFRLPLWEPRILDGFPLFAEGQIGALYPLHPLLYGLLPIDVATNYDILIHLAWVAVGTYLFARTLRLQPASAFLAAFAFSTGGFFIPRLQHMSVLATAAWLPWLLWAWEKYSVAPDRRSRLRWFALLALFSGIQLLGGHPQFAFLSAILVTLYAIVRWRRDDAAPKKPNFFFEYFDLPRLVPIILFFAIGAALASAQLLPTFELSSFSDRATGLLPKFFNAFSLRLVHYLMLLNPFLLGNPYPKVSVEVIGYIGVLPLFLALGTPLFKRDRRVVFFGAIALVALFLGLGDQNIFYRGLRYLPLFNYFRVPSRFFYWYTFAAAILAAITFDELLTRARAAQAWTRAQRTTLGALVALVAALIVLVRALPLETWLAAWVWLPLILALFAAWVLLGARRGLFSRVTLTMLALGVVVIDLGCFAAVYSKTYDEMMPLADFSAKPQTLSMLKDLSPQDGRVLTSLWIYPVPETMRESMYPNLSMTYNVPNAIGYTPLISERTGKYLEQINAPMLSLSNIRYYLIPQMLPVDPQTEGDDLKNQFAPDFIGPSMTFASTAAAKIKIISSLAQSVDLRDGDPVARVSVMTLGGDSFSFSLRAGIDTAEWAYERSDVRKVIQHSMPPVATTFPAFSGFPVEQHVGHNYLAQIDVTLNGQPRPITGISITPLINPGLLHIEKISFVAPDGAETSLAHLIGRSDQTLIYRDAQHVAVFANPDALPRAFLVHAAHLADDDAALKEMTQDTFAPLQSLILADGTPMQGEGAQRADEQVQIVDYQPERVVLSVHASAPGYVLLADAWYPGWAAKVDGVDAPIHRADYIFRAVAVSAGTHQIVFEYRPTTLYLGAAVSALALLIVIGIFAASRCARRRIPQVVV
ncbi:MAG TPA: YfhO family protein, partial [Anaerolineae bacterium]